MTTNKHALTANHWGVGVAHIENGKLVKISPHPDDPASSQLNDNVASSLNGSARVLYPSIRRSWLENGPGRGDKDRGQDEFVRVSWEKANKLIAAEINRIRNTYSNESIFAGSYGWASAGRFHHAQSQLHRFLNCIGGYTGSRNAYSFAAAEVILPHVIGHYEDLLKAPSSWETIQNHCELMVCFGGMPIRNSQITNGGMAKHVQRDSMIAAKNAGVKFINISPHRDDVIGGASAKREAQRRSLCSQNI